MESNRKPTLIDFRIKLPAVGTVFVHTARPDRPLMITSVDQEEIHRVDLDGLTKCWGSADDWREEMRSRTIEEVYHPGKK
jgi:hypothetical protein